MNKRPFILIEVLIAIALLALCAFPLISEPLFSQKTMRKKFFELELEREAEKIYYEILKTPLEFSKIPKENPPKTKLPPLEISIEGLGRKTYMPYYYLYHNARKERDNGIYKIHLGICFTDRDHKDQQFKYKFKFVGKIVAKKTPDPHGEDKTPHQKNERSSSDIQTLRQSE